MAGKKLAGRLHSRNSGMALHIPVVVLHILVAALHILVAEPLLPSAVAVVSAAVQAVAVVPAAVQAVAVVPARVAQNAGQLDIAVLKRTDDAVLVGRHRFYQLAAVTSKIPKLALLTRGNKTGLEQSCH